MRPAIQIKNDNGNKVYYDMKNFKVVGVKNKDIDFKSFKEIFCRINSHLDRVIFPKITYSSDRLELLERLNAAREEELIVLRGILNKELGDNKTLFQLFWSFQCHH